LCRVNLNLAGIETVEAEDGAQALELARSELPDLILLDVMLPRVEGWTVVEELQSAEATRDIPVVFLSARSDPADRRRGYELGGIGYVTKPFEPANLTELVRETLVRIARGEREQLRQERFGDLGSGG
jgi:two-component system response regulator VicR